MENTLKKALSEVLTPQYAEELRDSYDKGYIFSEIFETRMNELIRCTDRPPIYRYRGWIAAAACAVLAVGSAVMIPMLTNNDIKTVDTEESTASLTEPVPADSSIKEVSVSESETSEIVTSGSETSPVGTGEDNGGVLPDETKTTSVTEESGTPDVTDGSVINTDIDTDTDKGTEPTDSGNVGEIPLVDEKPVDNSADGIPLVDEKPVDDISSGGEKETVTDEPGGETYNIKVPAGTKLSQVFSDNFDITFDDMWANYAEYCPEGVHAYGRYGWVYSSNAEYAFLQDFVHNLGNAEKLEDGFGIDEGEAYITIAVNPEKRKMSEVNYSNGSSWKYYDQFFNVNEDESDDTVYEDHDEPGASSIVLDEYITESGGSRYYPAFKVTIYKNSGCMSFSYIEYYNDQSNRTDLYMIGYYRMDKADVDKLFGSFEKLFLSGEPKTVSDFSSDLGITADNIASAYADIDYIYDTDINGAKLKPDYVESFFKKHGEKKLDNTQYTVTGEDGNIYTFEHTIRNWCGGFTVMLKNGASVRVKLSTDGKCVLTDGIKNFYFDITLDDIKEVVKAAGDNNGFEVPFWSTLEEYLEGKNFGELRYAETYNVKKDDKLYMVTVTDEETLKTLHDMIVSEAKDAEYLPGHRDSWEIMASISVKGYSSAIYLGNNDRLLIDTFSMNIFKMPDGFNERFISVLTECSTAKWWEETELPDDEEYQGPDGPVSLDGPEAVDN